MTVYTNARIVTPTGVIGRGWLEAEHGRITGVGTGDRRGRDLAGAWLLPGFVDLHVHGGGGHSAMTSSDAIREAVAFHRARGTTTTLVSLVTAPLEHLAKAAGWIADLTEEGLVEGCHFEGPFLAHSRCGAQDPAALRPPSLAELRLLLDAGRGTVRQMTVAPELVNPDTGDDGIDLVRELVSRGVIAAVGHTDATYAQARAAFRAGAALVTHAFNGMRGLHHREPGPFVAAVESPGVILEVINDGIHLDPAIMRLAHGLAPDRLALITDAIDATGMGDGEYRLGAMRVRVSDGVARLVEGGSLAGSTLTMDAALRRAVKEVGLPIETASRYASAIPAKVLGLGDRGTLVPGRRADLVILDGDLNVVEVP
ncbi:N-acetylglucosamine-6-phosphate deacetylase [Actinocorallia sp. API 0066]|uniref:N-acetylglucosamine-6-phosphate deacetylase n=1 Tax=Actinocorallia sp. API 0066 TaxID=2896846 RepID=UPI001E56E4D1|nr:N-acetylglucosamine-6-phosphate deacetylase [Actinocorallia sp. API 0066]MCD0451292.1 N-acetylglucosamine-6-phosphate deacetylase [Actinocorallia sp. API 0066]